MEEPKVAAPQALDDEFDMKRSLNGSLMGLKEEALPLNERISNTKAYLALHEEIGVQSDKKSLYGQMKEWVKRAEGEMAKIRKEFSSLFEKVKTVDPEGPFMRNLRIDEFVVLTEDPIERDPKAVPEADPQRA